MTVPRNTLDYTDVNPKTQLAFDVDGVTVTYDDTVARGASQAGWGAVGFSADHTVELRADAEKVEGMLLLIEPDNRATVRTVGSFKFKAGTGATFTIGRGVVGALRSAAPGYVRGVAVGTQDEEDIEFGRVVDDSDADAIVVLYP